MVSTVQKNKTRKPPRNGTQSRNSFMNPPAAESNVIEAEPEPAIEVVALNKVVKSVSSIDIGNDNAVIVFGPKPKDVLSIPSVTAEFSEGCQPISYTDGTGATLRVNGKTLMTGRAALESSQDSVRTSTASFSLKPINALFFHLSWVTAHHPDAAEIHSYVTTQAQNENMKEEMAAALNGRHEVEVLSSRNGEVVVRRVTVVVTVLRVMGEGAAALIASRTLEKGTVEGKTLAIDIGAGTMIGLAVNGSETLLTPEVGEDQGVIALVEAIRRAPELQKKLKIAVPAQYQLVVNGLVDGSFSYWTAQGSVSFQSEYKDLLIPSLGDPLVRFVSYCLSLIPEGRIDKLLLLSGGAKLPGLLEYVASKFPGLKAGASSLGSRGNATGLYLLAMAIFKEMEGASSRG
jgi:hypothetical protein